MSTKTTVQMRFPEPRSSRLHATLSAVDHLQRLLQAPAHPVEGPAEHGDLVLALLGNSATSKSPVLTWSAARDMSEIGRTIIRFSITLSTTKTTANTAASEPMNA